MDLARCNAMVDAGATYEELCEAGFENIAALKIAQREEKERGKDKSVKKGSWDWLDDKYINHKDGAGK